MTTWMRAKSGNSACIVDAHNFSQHLILAKQDCFKQWLGPSSEPMLYLLSLITQTIGVDSTPIIVFVQPDVLKHISELPKSLSMRSLNILHCVPASATSTCSVSNTRVRQSASSPASASMPRSKTCSGCNHCKKSSMPRPALSVLVCAVLIATRRRGRK